MKSVLIPESLLHLESTTSHVSIGRSGSRETVEAIAHSQINSQLLPRWNIQNPLSNFSDQNQILIVMVAYLIKIRRAMCPNPADRIRRAMLGKTPGRRHLVNLQETDRIF